MRWRIPPLAALGVLGLAGCSSGIDGGQCNTDSDCGGGETCLYDLTRDTTYCSVFNCNGDDDCPDFQVCRTAFEGDRLMSEQIRVCIDRIRACTDEDGNPNPELCNGLDDDCDGVVDGPNCETITRCLDDAPCGAYVCTAPENQPFTLCGPPNAAATVPDFEVCSRDDECTNGLCEAGICAPMCRPFDTDICRSVVGADGRSVETFCAEGIGPVDRPRHNLCQKICAISGAPCTSEEICAWRPVFQAGDETRMFVCTRPDLNRKPLGAPCSGNDLEGDNECQHGLCFGGVCSRICRRGADDCASDLGPGFVCQARDIIYRVFTFSTDICVSDS